MAAQSTFHSRPGFARRWKGTLAGLAAAPLARVLPPRCPGSFGILMYHRVTDSLAGASEPTWNVPPAVLRRQLAGLSKLGYQAWPLRKALVEHAAGRPIPPRVFVVTFDDGYVNNFTQAYPVLRSLNVPATLFLATAYLDSPDAFPSDDWADAGRADIPADAWRPLTTAEARALAADGLFELAAHTHTHADFRGRPDALEADLRLCCDVLEQRFEVRNPTFAFPYGTKHLGFSGPPLSHAARRAGVCCALTTEADLVRPGSDPFDWPRHTATAQDTAATLAAKLDGWYGLLRDTWRTVRRAGPVMAPVTHTPENALIAAQ